MEPAQQLFWMDYLGDLSVRVNVARKRTCKPNWGEYDVTPSFNRMYFIVGGTGSLRINEQEFIPQAGEWYLFPAGTKQRLLTDPEHPLIRYYVHFTAKVKSNPLFDMIHVPYRVEQFDRSLVKGHLDRIVQSRQQLTLTSNMNSNAALLQLLVHYFDQSFHQKRFNLDSIPAMDKIHMLVGYIDTHLSEKISIDKLAALIHLHPNYLITYFKKYMGISPVQYITHRRMERAKQLLSSSSATVSEIAQELGLELYYFSRVFKQHTGLSPSLYRDLQ